MPTSALNTAAMAMFILGLGLPIAVGQEAVAVTGDTGIYAADPSVIHTDAGYVAVESRGGRSLFVRVAATLQDLADARATRIWSDKGLGEVWAPEIVFRGGRYEIHFTAGLGSEHRMYSITSAEPAAGYGEPMKTSLPDEKWAIDGLPFHYRGTDYFIWSGWQGDTDIQQDIFIARWSAEGAAAGARVLIASPDEAWENVAGETPSINEGPQPIIDPAGQMHIVYSANGSWGPNYCLADLRLRAEADPLDPAAWVKSDGCLFGANMETLADGDNRAGGAKGVGHHSFVLVDGAVEGAAQDATVGRPFLYHGVPAAEEPSNFWAARKWFIGSYRWLPDVTYGADAAADTGWSLSFSE